MKIIVTGFSKLAEALEAIKNILPNKNINPEGIQTAPPFTILIEDGTNEDFTVLQTNLGTESVSKAGF